MVKLLGDQFREWHDYPCSACDAWSIARVSEGSPVRFDPSPGMCLSPDEQRSDASERDYWVQVCTICLTASCWHAKHMCQDSRSAGVVLRKASELRALNLEHPGNYSRRTMRITYGGVDNVEVQDPPWSANGTFASTSAPPQTEPTLETLQADRDAVARIQSVQETRRKEAR
jgi:hypothetical protein